MNPPLPVLYPTAVSMGFFHAQIDPVVHSLDDAAGVELSGLKTVHQEVHDPSDQALPIHDILNLHQSARPDSIYIRKIITDVAAAFTIVVIAVAVRNCPSSIDDSPGVLIGGPPNQQENKKREISVDDVKNEQGPTHLPGHHITEKLSAVGSMGAQIVGDSDVQKDWLAGLGLRYRF